MTHVTTQTKRGAEVEQKYHPFANCIHPHNGYAVLATWLALLCLEHEALRANHPARLLDGPTCTT
jgi:hypothetical protein